MFAANSLRPTRTIIQRNSFFTVRIRGSAANNLQVTALAQFQTLEYKSTIMNRTRILIGALLLLGSASALQAAVHESDSLPCALQTVVFNIDGQLQTFAFEQLIDLEQPIGSDLAGLVPAGLGLAIQQGDLLGIIDCLPLGMHTECSLLPESHSIKNQWVASQHGNHQQFDFAMTGPFVPALQQPIVRSSHTSSRNWFQSSGLAALAGLLLGFVAGSVAKEQVQLAAQGPGEEKPPLPHAIAKLILRHAPKFIGAQEAVQVATSLGMPANEAKTQYMAAQDSRQDRSQ